MNNVGKNWDETEENKLIESINKLVHINKIAEKHQRQIGGVRARIKKIIDDPNKSSKIKNINEIIVQYFGETTNSTLSKEEYINLLKNIKSNVFKYNTLGDILEENNIGEYQAKKILEKIIEKEDSDSKIKKKINKLLNSKVETDNNKIIIDNEQSKVPLSNSHEKQIIDFIMDFDSLFTIKKVFTNLEINDIKTILKDYLQSDNVLPDKKTKIKFILKKYKHSKEEDFYDKEFDAEKIKKKIFVLNTTEQKNNINNKIVTLQNNFNSQGIVNNFNPVQDVIKLLNDINYQLKIIKTDINNLNKKIDTINSNNKVDTININPNYNNDKEISDEDLENELNKYI